MLEGGAAGIVDMRSVRPFDKRGFRSAFQVVVPRTPRQAGARAARPSSATPGTTSLAPWSALLGQQQRSTRRALRPLAGPMPASRPPKAPAPRATAPAAATGPSGNVPANAGSGLVTNDVINEAFLLARTPAPASPDRQRPDSPPGPPHGIGGHAGPPQCRGRPGNPLNDDLELYLDVMAGKKKNKIERSDMNWVGRFGAMVPLNLQIRPQ